MKHYEILYILAPDLSEEQHAKTVALAEDLIKNEGGKIAKSEILGKKKLAYAIKKATLGSYCLFEFDLEPAKLSGLEQKFRLMTEILRFLITVKDPTKERPKTVSLKPKAVEAPAPRIFKKEPTKEKPREKLQKVSIEELDKKLDEILKDDVVKE
ncbi:MAG: 30S ribosomal protein S6 [Patescibacteria group bacterium]